MSISMKQFFIALCVAALASGCSSTAEVAGEHGTIRIKEDAKPGGEPTEKYAATIRLLPYVDGRDMGNPRKIGVGGENIYGFHAPESNDILLDRDVAAVVTSAMKQRLEASGYRVVENGTAHFQMSGTVKELTYNVKARDEIAISVATELKDTNTGNVLWSGVVVEKKERFAGVSGNDISDVAAFLKKELGIITQKTSDAISAILMAQRPELFNLSPGTKPIAGVTVLSAPGVKSPAASAAPVPAASAPVAATPVAGAMGVLKITTKPARAKIHIGGVYYGLSPLRLELEPGIVEVTASMDRRHATEKVAVRKGETTELELKLGK
ncbi:MAG TPA: PEGA domain-containing protein [Gallionellaceae bacterium]